MTIQLNDQAIHDLHYDEIKQILKDEPFASFLGMKLTKLGPGTAEAELIPDDRMLNSHGTVHGAYYLFTCRLRIRCCEQLIW